MFYHNLATAAKDDTSNHSLTGVKKHSLFPLHAQVAENSKFKSFILDNETFLICRAINKYLYNFLYVVPSSNICELSNTYIDLLSEEWNFKSTLSHTSIPTIST